MKHDPDSIQKMLRLKRHERPPEGFFEDFLSEFQVRQRNVLLREPLWRIALDRIGAFFTTDRRAQWAYGTATIAVVAVAGYSVLPAGGPSPTTERVVSAPTPAAETFVATGPSALVSGEFAPLSVPGAGPQPPGDPSADARPHYVIDARPVSYAPPYRF